MNHNELLKIFSEHRTQRQRAETQRLLTIRPPSPNFPTGHIRMQTRARQVLAKIMIGKNRN